MIIDNFLEANPEYEFQAGEKNNASWEHYFKLLLKEKINPLRNRDLEKVSTRNIAAKMPENKKPSNALTGR